MKQISNLLLTVLLFVNPLCNIKGQTGSLPRDKYLLITMPYNMRPLSLYRGQFQANAGYKFAVRTKSYNSTGDLVYLGNNGNGTVYHYYFAELRYGLTNFIELGAETYFLRRGIRDATISVVNTSLSTTERVTVKKLTESKGMGDIFLYTTIRLPIEYRWFDFDLKGGLFIPSAKYEPQKPSNTVADVTNSNSYTVNLHYNNTNGYGVPVYMISAASKLSFGKFSVEAEWIMHDPVKEGRNIRWEDTMTDRVFSYYDKSYSYLLSRTVTFNTSLHYQATGWFNINLKGSILRTKGGWTEYWGNKYKNPEVKLFNIQPGFELQISPSLTVYQFAAFPLSGKNSDAPFSLLTTVSLNMFPFLR